MDDNPASDGETFFVTALIIASRRWGDDGAWNYSAEASLVLHAMLGKEAPPCGSGGCQSVVNMFGGYADPNPELVSLLAVRF
jgi:oligosaccharide reducing-end xylanase